MWQLAAALIVFLALIAILVVLPSATDSSAMPSDEDLGFTVPPPQPPARRARVYPMPGDE